MSKKSLKTSIEIYGTKEGDFNFKAEETFDDENTKHAWAHFPSLELLPRDAKNIEYSYGSDSICSSNDEEESSLLINKIMIEKV